MVTQGRRLRAVETKPPARQPAGSSRELLLRGRLPPRRRRGPSGSRALRRRGPGKASAPAAWERSVGRRRGWDPPGGCGVSACARLRMSPRGRIPTEETARARPRRRRRGLPHAGGSRQPRSPGRRRTVRAPRGEGAANFGRSGARAGARSLPPVTTGAAVLAPREPPSWHQVEGLRVEGGSGARAAAPAHWSCP
ncbi:uncharacterized protein LOC108591112 [Callithrix jacchus]